MKPGLNAILGPTGSGKSSWVLPFALQMFSQLFKGDVGLLGLGEDIRDPQAQTARNLVMQFDLTSCPSDVSFAGVLVLHLCHTLPICGLCYCNHLWRWSELRYWGNKSDLSSGVGSTPDLSWHGGGSKLSGVGGKLSPVKLLQQDFLRDADCSDGCQK